MLAAYRERERSHFDELLGTDGAPRPGWDSLTLDAWDREGLRAARGLAARLLEDDGVTYRPAPRGGTAGRQTGSPGGVAGRDGRWRLDPLPVVVPGAEWAEVERGVAQRARLLEAVLADLYGARRLLTSGLLPPDLVWGHGTFLRAAWGAHPADRPRLVLTGTDLGRDADGRWTVVADRTQAPSGLGYAMENRRVVARLLPDAYRRADLRRLTGFFTDLRDALLHLAPAGVEDPRVAVLTPGRWSETAFDQAHVASLLGFPLVTGDDLVVRGGRVRTRELGDRRAVDVLLRRVDDVWSDPLELRPDSELGVPGLLEAARRGTVVSANALGSGFVESPALAGFLPALCEALLDEPLLLPSAPSWWCGDPLGLAHVGERIGDLVLRPVDPARGRGTFGPALTAAQRERWRARLEREPTAWVGQEVLPLSTTPTASGAGIDPRPLTLRSFAVVREDGYAVMPGALGRIVPPGVDPRTGRRDGPTLSKDVWVLRPADVDVAVAEPDEVVVRPQEVPMVPRALENLFWLGRYAERAEATTRLVLVLRSMLDELPVARLDPARGAVVVLARAVARALPTASVSPSASDLVELADEDVDAELHSQLLDRDVPGSVAQSLECLVGAAGSVRDQLSSDVFLVLGGMERALEVLEGPGDGTGDPAARAEVRVADVGSGLRAAGVQVLSGTLALAGITAENMVRDVGWQLLDVGRGLERALQVTDLLVRVLGDVHPPAVERHLREGVLTATESLVTHRRRYAGHEGVESVLGLLLLDPGNPRSVASQVARAVTGLSGLPGADRPAAVALLGTLADAAVDLRARPARALAASFPRTTETDELFTEHRDELVGLCERTTTRLRAAADALAAVWFSPLPAPRPMGSAFAPPAAGPAADPAAGPGPDAGRVGRTEEVSP